MGARNRPHFRALTYKTMENNTELYRAISDAAVELELINQELSGLGEFLNANEN